MKGLVEEIRSSIVATVLLALLCCGAYPVIVWAAGQLLFPRAAGGSLVLVDGRVAGSELLAQGFTGPRYFHPRPSAAGKGYDAAGSGGSNLGPTSKKLIEDVKRRVEEYRKGNAVPPGTPIPADAVTSSASGLDPHISVRNAELQAGRVAAARGMTREEVTRKVKTHTEGRWLGLLGEPRVNVLMLNLDLDGKS